MLAKCLANKRKYENLITNQPTNQPTKQCTSEPAGMVLTLINNIQQLLCTTAKIVKIHSHTHIDTWCYNWRYSL